MATSSEVLKEIASIFNITVDEIKDKNRHDEVSYPRKVWLYVCHKHLNIPKRELSRKLDRELSYTRHELKIIDRHISNSENKWLCFWNKYERESMILKQLIKNAA